LFFPKSEENRYALRTPKARKRKFRRLGLIKPVTSELSYYVVFDFYCLQISPLNCYANINDNLISFNATIFRTALANPLKKNVKQLFYRISLFYISLKTKNAASDRCRTKHVVFMNWHEFTMNQWFRHHELDFAKSRYIFTTSQVHLHEFNFMKSRFHLLS
jgi:hypothetical protein